MIQITEMRLRFGRTTVACGMSPDRGGSTIECLPFERSVPEQARVEGLRRKHGEHHHGHEEHHTRAGLDGHQRLQLYQRHDERINEHVEHRPAADELDHAIHTGALVPVPDLAPLHLDQQVGKGNELAERDHDTCDEHDERERPRARGVEEYHATHDRVGLGRSESGRGEDWKQVRGYVEDRRGDDERPGVLDGMFAAPHEGCTAARAVPRVGGIGGSGEQVAGRAGEEPRFDGAQRVRAHRTVPAVSALVAIGGSVPSAHSILAHTSRGSRVTRTAASKNTKAPAAYIPMPGITVASCAILNSATKMPSIITSVIDHGSMKCAERSISPTQCGAGGRRTAMSTTSRNSR